MEIFWVYFKILKIYSSNKFPITKEIFSKVEF